MAKRVEEWEGRGRLSRPSEGWWARRRSGRSAGGAPCGRGRWRRHQSVKLLALSLEGVGSQGLAKRPKRCLPLLNLHPPLQRARGGGGGTQGRARRRASACPPGQHQHLGRRSLAAGGQRQRWKCEATGSVSSGTGFQGLLQRPRWLARSDCRPIPRGRRAENLRPPKSRPSVLHPPPPALARLRARLLERVQGCPGPGPRRAATRILPSAAETRFQEQVRSRSGQSP